MRGAEQLNHDAAQPPVAGLVVIARMPMLPYREAFDRDRARMNRQIARLSQCLADMTG